MAKNAQLRANVRGRVQGVSYRAFVLARANSLDLNGYARNKIDGSVDVLAEGARANLELLLDFLREGPPAARVEQVTHEWYAASGDYDHFEIR